MAKLLLIMVNIVVISSYVARRMQVLKLQIFFNELINQWIAIDVANIQLFTKIVFIIHDKQRSPCPAPLLRHWRMVSRNRLERTLYCMDIW